MKAKQLRELEINELVTKKEELEKEIVEMSFDIKTGIEQDKRGFKLKKKVLARVNTLITEKS